MTIPVAEKGQVEDATTPGQGNPESAEELTGRFAALEKKYQSLEATHKALQRNVGKKDSEITSLRDMRIEIQGLRGMMEDLQMRNAALMDTVETLSSGDNLASAGNHPQAGRHTTEMLRQRTEEQAKATATKPAENPGAHIALARIQLIAEKAGLDLLDPKLKAAKALFAQGEFEEAENMVKTIAGQESGEPSTPAETDTLRKSAKAPATELPKEDKAKQAWDFLKEQGYLDSDFSQPVGGSSELQDTEAKYVKGEVGWDEMAAARKAHGL